MNIEEAKANGWVREDQLPTITTREYNLWCSNSQIIDGVRMGPCLREILPTDLKNIKLSLDNAGESFIETSREDRKFQYVKGEDYSFIEDAQLGIGGVSISALTEWLKSESVYTALRYAAKNPSNSGVDNCEDRSYLHLYNLICQIRRH